MNVFEEINNAVLDLQSANHQSVERPLRKLNSALISSELEAVNSYLLSLVNVDEFLEESSKTGGSMMGSTKLLWPEKNEEYLGICLALIDRFANDPEQLWDFGHTYYHSGNSLNSSIRAVVGQMIVPFARDYKDYVSQQENQPKVRKGTLALPLSKRVFIVHGHDEGARESVARFLEKLDFIPIILHEQANKGQTIIEKIEANSDVSFAVVLLTPDDEGCTKGETPKPRARQNVLLELGYFLAKLGRENVCALHKASVEIPTDYAGVIWTKFDNHGSWKNALAKELLAAGHQVDLNKTI
jgi:predicted nucleotide-binding protein